MKSSMARPLSTTSTNTASPQRQRRERLHASDHGAAPIGRFPIARRPGKDLAPWQTAAA